MITVTHLRLGPHCPTALTLQDGPSDRLRSLAAKVLSPPEHDLWHSFGQHKKQREWLAGRLAAKIALRRQMPRLGPLRTLSLLPREGRSGPVAGPQGWQVSLAHSGAYALAACARHPLGVDIETRTTFRPEILPYFLSTTERDLLGPLPPDDPRLPVLWAVKEAVLKTRLARSLAEISDIFWTGWGHGCRIAVKDARLPCLTAFGGIWRGTAVAVASAHIRTEARA
ncbi:4'-phosphopantetheinyl transferase superfamily protein [Thioclava sp. GXIMD4216]|uniref:4'-phosphopantetheinyl transferase family protein n=1 Tax=Thioclava sp. GXIMD4216 TaxID=3131929 RepID=UPI0030D62837